MEPTGGGMIRVIRLRSGRSSYSDYWSLHTAGPDIPDRATPCTYEGQQPLARDPAGAGGVARAKPGWNGLAAETAVSRAGRAWTKMWRYRYVPFYGHSL